MPFAAWQAMDAAATAREVHLRVTALPEKLRAAAVAWIRPETDVSGWNGLTSSRSERVEVNALHLLRGIPYALKDLFDLAGAPTKAGSTFLEKVRPTPTASSAIVTRLGAAGAACATKTHLVEFASGLTGENPHYGDCPHPCFPDRLTGGSSSGSAALVAAGVVPLGIGTDTGGSVRVPAAWCGLYGFRLTPGDALIRDAFPLAPTMDTAGWFTANATDLLTVWDCLGASTGPAKIQSLRGRFLPARTLLPTIDATVADACDRAAARFATATDGPTTASLLTAWETAVDNYVTIGMSEAHAVHRDWLAPYREHYDPAIWQRFTNGGTFSPAAISAARANLERIRSHFREFFSAYDFLVLPAVPTAAPTKAECTAELRRAILTLTAPASLGGLACLSLPVALPNGLTAGLQVLLPQPDSPVVPALLAQR